MRFALNRIAAPQMPLPNFLAMARRQHVTDVEIRNNLSDDIGTILPRALREMAGNAGVRLTINGLYPFKFWSDDLASRAARLANYAADAVIDALVMCPLNGGRKVDHFALVHDTFHHRLAGEDRPYPHRTAYVHISGMVDPQIPLEALEDEHRELIDLRDLLNNLGQLWGLLADEFKGSISFRPFSPETHANPNIEIALAESMGFLRRALDENG